MRSPNKLKIVRIEEPSHKWKGFFEDLRNRPTTGLPNPPLKGWDCGMAIVQPKTSEARLLFPNTIDLVKFECSEREEKSVK